MVLLICSIVCQSFFQGFLEFLLLSWVCSLVSLLSLDFFSFLEVFRVSWLF